jgi:pSer/pThr/pTyr-binding forkhead associated (FHA) protein
MLALSSYAQKALRSEEELLASLTCPLLVWETVASKPPSDEDHWQGTASGAHVLRPREGEPVVLELKKAAGQSNPFSMGITLGRANNNDLVLSDKSVSRFHAYFLKSREGWAIVDAESRNGSWVNGGKLSGTKPTPVIDGSRIKIGDLDLRFYLPVSFAKFLRERMG